MSGALRVLCSMVVALVVCGGTVPCADAHAAIDGQRKVIVAVAEPSSDAESPYFRSYLEAQLHETREWFRQVSGGRLAFEFTVVTGPVPTSATCAGLERGSVNDELGWLRAHGHDLTRYSFSIIAYPDVGYCSDAAAWADTSRRAVVAFAWPSAAVLVHELGHMLGLGHANSVDCGLDATDPGAPLFSCPNLATSDSAEYGDTDSVMGFGGSQDSFTSFHLARLGWLQPMPVVRGRYTLEGLGAQCGTRALTVETREQTIWIEYPQVIDRATGSPYDWSDIGVQIHAEIRPGDAGQGWGDVARFTWLEEGRYGRFPASSLWPAESLRLGPWLAVRVDSIENGQAVVAVEWSDTTAPMFDGRAEVFRTPEGYRFKWPVGRDAESGVQGYALSVDGRAGPVEPGRRSTLLPRLKPGRHVVTVVARDFAGNERVLRAAVDVRFGKAPRVSGARVSATRGDHFAPRVPLVPCASAIGARQ